MKCVYCNTEKDLTVSDIIPYALTGAKVQKRFVCRTHNGFTNDHYEKQVNANFAVYRNLLGLAERDGDPVRFFADLNIGGHTVKAVISDRESIFGKGRMFSTTDENGKKTLVGDLERIRKMRRFDPKKLKEVDLADISYHVNDSMERLFISSEVLHTVAKIAYEWHCYSNKIEQYHEEKYHEIVSYILTPESPYCPVEIVAESPLWTIMDYQCRVGTNMLFEYTDSDGNLYVIFGFWGVILYKVRICRSDRQPEPDADIYTIHLYHVDGTEETAPTGMMSLTGVFPSIYSVPPAQGMPQYCNAIKDRLSQITMRSLSKEYLKKQVDKIKKILPAYETGKTDYKKVLAFGDDDRFFAVYVLELLYCNRDNYEKSETFDQNIKRILQEDEVFTLTAKIKNEALARYVDMDRNGTLLGMLQESIDFFDSITGT